MEHYIFTLHLRCALHFQVALSCRQLGFTAWDLLEKPGREVQLTFGSCQGLPGIYSNGGKTYQRVQIEKRARGQDLGAQGDLEVKQSQARNKEQEVRLKEKLE